MNKKTTILSEKFIKMPELNDLSYDIVSKNWILDQLETLIFTTKESLLDKQKQGFIALEISDINQVKEEIDALYHYFADNMLFNQSIKFIIDNTKKMFKSKFNKRHIISILYQLLSKLEAIIISYAITKEGNRSFVSIDKYSIYTFIYMPNTVKLIHFKKDPEAYIKSIVISKDINFFVYKDDIIENKTYYFDELNNKISLKEINVKDELVNDNKKLDNFKIGIEINDFNDLKNKKNTDVDFILIQPENAYIKSQGLINLEERINFYKSLYEAYKESEIILELPKLDILYAYHFEDSDYTMDKQNFLRHYYMFIKELEAATQIHNRNLKISIPNLAYDKDFKELKKQIHYWLKILKRDYPLIGFTIETEASYDYSEFYKKFDFVCIDLDRLFEEISLSDNKDYFYKDVSYLNQLMKIRKKEVYLIGKDISNPTIFSKFVNKGFKNFVISNKFIPYYQQIISKYNFSRGKFKKIK